MYSLWFLHPSLLVELCVSGDLEKKDKLSMESVKEVVAISSSEAQPEESGKGVKCTFSLTIVFLNVFIVKAKDY